MTDTTINKKKEYAKILNSTITKLVDILKNTTRLNIFVMLLIIYMLKISKTSDFDCTKFSSYFDLATGDLLLPGFIILISTFLFSYAKLIPGEIEEYTKLIVIEDNGLNDKFIKIFNKYINLIHFLTISNYIIFFLGMIYLAFRGFQDEHPILFIIISAGIALLISLVMCSQQSNNGGLLVHLKSKLIDDQSQKNSSE